MVAKFTADLLSH